MENENSETGPSIPTPRLPPPTLAPPQAQPQAQASPTPSAADTAPRLPSANPVGARNPAATRPVSAIPAATTSSAADDYRKRNTAGARWRRRMGMLFGLIVIVGGVGAAAFGFSKINLPGTTFGCGSDADKIATRVEQYGNNHDQKPASLAVVDAWQSIDVDDLDDWNMTLIDISGGANGLTTYYEIRITAKSGTRCADS